LNYQEKSSSKIFNITKIRKGKKIKKPIFKINTENSNICSVSSLNQNHFNNRKKENINDQLSVVETINNNFDKLFSFKNSKLNFNKIDKIIETQINYKNEENEEKYKIILKQELNNINTNTNLKTNNNEDSLIKNLIITKKEINIENLSLSSLEKLNSQIYDNYNPFIVDDLEISNDYKNWKIINTTLINNMIIFNSISNLQNKFDFMKKNIPQSKIIFFNIF
jgi:hypothetical protein